MPDVNILAEITFQKLQNDVAEILYINKLEEVCYIVSNDSRYCYGRIAYLYDYPEMEYTNDTTIISEEVIRMFSTGQEFESYIRQHYSSKGEHAIRKVLSLYSDILA